MPTLDGNKTYIVAAIYIAAVIAEHYLPGPNWEAIKGVIAGFGLVTLRHGISTSQPTVTPTKEGTQTNV